MTRRISWGECHLEEGEWSADVRYDILIETVSNGQDLFCEDYGARIALSPKTGVPEVVELRGITPYRHAIERFVDDLRRHGVTPATAGDVLEDYLATLE